MSHKHHGQQYQIASDCHDRADVKDLKRTDDFAQQGIKNHHGENLNCTAKGIEQHIAVIPVRSSNIIFKEVNQQIRGNVKGTVNEHNRNHHRHCLIVGYKCPEHLLYRRSIQIHGGLFLNIQAGNADHNDKQYRNNQCKPLETAPFHFSCCLRIS